MREGFYIEFCKTSLDFTVFLLVCGCWYFYFIAVPQDDFFQTSCDRTVGKQPIIMCHVKELDTSLQ